MTRPRSYILFFISKWLLIAYSLLSSFLYFSQTYTSINDGAWNNTTNVWSLDGVTPCGCQPGHVGALIVIVQNNLTLSGDLEIKNAGNLTISSIGEITTSSKGVRVINGLLTNHGIFNIKSLEVKPAGVVTLSGKSTFDNKFFIEGICNLDSNLTITDANLELKAGGIMNFNTGSNLNLLNGNISNNGLTAFNIACVHVYNGSWSNNVTGALTGVGFANLLSGGITNNGAWSVNVEWCATSSGTGLPIPQNCTANPCSILLPTALVSFDVVVNWTTATLNWTTASEINNDFFTVERSIDGSNFEEIIWIQGAGNSNHTLHYEAIDNNQMNGLVYYRLKQTDFDGEFRYSEIILVEMNTIVSSTSVFPNPFKEGVLNISGISSEDEEMTLVFYNQLGDKIYSTLISAQNNNFVTSVNLQNRLSAGIYIIVGTNKSETGFMQKLVVR